MSAAPSPLSVSTSMARMSPYSSASDRRSLAIPVSSSRRPVRMYQPRPSSHSSFFLRQESKLDGLDDIRKALASGQGVLSDNLCFDGTEFAFTELLAQGGVHLSRHGLFEFRLELVGTQLVRVLDSEEFRER